MTGRPHIAFPPRLANGSLTSVEQDSPEHVGQRLLLLFSVVLGTVVDTPEFGIPEQAFTSVGTDLATLRQAADQWVPASNAVVTDSMLIGLARKVGVTVNTPGGTNV